MLGLGGGEAIIIFLVVLLLFGPTVIAFFVGYTLGQRRGGESAEKVAPISSEPPTAVEPPIPAGPPAVPPLVPEPPAAGRTEAPADDGDADV